MRTFLTYVLAALAGAVVATALYPIAIWAIGADFAQQVESDPSLTGRELWVLVTLFLFVFVALALAGSLLWWLASKRFGGSVRKFGLIGYAVLGAVLIFFVGWGSAVAFIAPTLNEFGIGLGTDLGNSALLQLAVHPGAILAATGLAWGTVFWLREPRRAEVQTA